jgi:hypothetical protein
VRRAPRHLSFRILVPVFPESLSVVVSYAMTRRAYGQSQLKVLGLTLTFNPSHPAAWHQPSASAPTNRCCSIKGIRYLCMGCRTARSASVARCCIVRAVLHERTSCTPLLEAARSCPIFRSSGITGGVIRCLAHSRSLNIRASGRSSKAYERVPKFRERWTVSI